MDKAKSGKLIRDARKSKNYTQSELGDMLGVTNKAVSRWEGGESFPDVSILENLAQVLDLKIQDIVTGEIKTDNEADEETASEILRIATVQIRSKKKRIVSLAIAVVLLLCSMFAVFVAILRPGIIFNDASGVFYYIMMTATLIVLVYGSYAHVFENKPLRKSDRLIGLLSAVLYAWMIIMIWSVSLPAVKGYHPFGVSPEKLGPFVNIQLIAIVVINLLFLIVEIAAMWNEFQTLHFGFVFQTASLYMAALYGDLLHRLGSFDGYIKNLAIRTILGLICTAAALTVMKMTKKIKE